MLRFGESRRNRVRESRRTYRESRRTHRDSRRSHRESSLDSILDSCRDQEWSVNLLLNGTVHKVIINVFGL